MRLEWDEAKNRANIRKHGLDFADAEVMFHAPLLVSANLEEDCGERRWIGIDAIGERIAAVIFAERDAETIRIISPRKADYEERKEYEKAIQDRLETN